MAHQHQAALSRIRQAVDFSGCTSIQWRPADFNGIIQHSLHKRSARLISVSQHVPARDDGLCTFAFDVVESTLNYGEWN